MSRPPRAQRAFLQERDVRVAHGFFVGRPVPAAELYDRLHRSPAAHLQVPARRL